MVRLRTAVVLALRVSCILTLAPVPAGAACPEPMATARIVSIDNSVELKDASESVFLPASLKGFVCHGDSIRVGGFSRATVAFLNSGLRLTIEQNTEWLVRQPRAPGRSLIELIRGAILFFTSQPGALDVQTPFVNAAVQGTEFLVRVEGDRTDVAVIEGTVALENVAGRLTLTSGQSGQAVAGQAPQLIDIRPRDAVRWALYYEPILPADSREQLDQVPAADRDAQFYVRRASVMLAVGRIDEARGDITTAKGLDPRNGEAFALDAIIAVAQNDGAGALENGRRAVELSPQSVSARVALSYAFQAQFQLEAARDELLQIVPASPAQDRAEHAGALARLAELWLSLGYLDRALNAANRAVVVAPNLARTQTVLGFAALTRLDTFAAKAAFDRAISLESKSPLARLGLGLAMIREGNLSGGRSELETAAALNVEDALIRSYLGKAYFEEKREPLPGRQFDLAKQLDRLDPTPWFYDAIRKQTLNRPVEALQDLQRSIELNDNRAVYRSRLLLDQDLAARSAGLGRIYRDLGFEQLALVEGWNSVNRDAGDHSGHRFLADVYSALPRHEIARISELLQSQLLQPINIGAVQPQLAEANLSVLDGSGPAEPAFNEFNPLFNRNRLSFLISGAAGGHEILGDEIVLSGLWNKISFSVGQYHFDSVGFQENNAQDRDIVNAFVQASVSPSTSIQGEVRSTDHVRGDLQLRFDPRQLRAARTQKTDFGSARLGIRQAFSPRSQVIASFIYGRVNDRADDRLVELGFPGNPGSLAIDVHRRGWITEAQHLYRSERIRIASGLGRFQADRDEAVDLGIHIPVPPFVIRRPTFEARQISHTNGYMYSQVDVQENVTVTLGASGDFFVGRVFEADQFNPKAGVSWQPTRTTTVRAAGFRTLQRSLISNQTIEPTQVAGFNQLFDGVEGEAAWRYGLAVDQRVSRELYAGAELSWRDLVHPSVPVAGGEVVRDDWKERFGRAYLYSTPHPRIGLSLEYMFERFERKGSFGDEQIVELGTHRVPLGFAYFHPVGLIARVKSTIVRQAGIFGTTNLPAPGEDTFGIVDGSIGYRLPKRHGLITLDAKNLLDQQFRFQDTDPKSPRIVPGRLVVVRFTLTM